jgi:hypothetical protein
MAEVFCQHGLDKPFRPKRVINSAILEAVMVAMLENPQIDSKKLARNYPRLMKDHTFSEFVTGATTDTAVLKGRILQAQKILSE